MFDFDREWCTDTTALMRREWLVTNGIGGYACGTVAGMLARHYHGLLIAALEPPLGRMLLLAKLNETATYQHQTVPLYTDHWADGTIAPDGYSHLERFRLEGTTPIWTYKINDALLEKRIWMEHGQNTTYIQYALLQASSRMDLQFDVLVNYRDHHSSTVAHDWFVSILPQDDGLCVLAHKNATPFWVRSDRAEVHPDHTWSTGYFKAIEASRGEYDGDDHLYAGYFASVLDQGESVTFAATTEELPEINAQAAYERRQRYEAAVIAAYPDVGGRPEIQQLALAADQFIVKRTSHGDSQGLSMLAGYPWFSDWGRDTMIALPGLTLAVGRPIIAERILRTFARFVSQGMIPNRFPDEGEEPEYNTVDATLWYFEAVRAYYHATADIALIRDLYPILSDMITWHVRGTRYNIHADPADGLLFQGEEGVQLTWMDVKIDNWVVTPRTGKPVEINALWYNALQIMVEFSELLGNSAEVFQNLSTMVRDNFGRFWNEQTGYCYDVIDAPSGDDVTLRPNQIIAAAMTSDLLSKVQRTSIVQVCEEKLLTPYGLRSLAPDQPDYKAHYGGPRPVRDAAYHQGTVWAWLVGPFIEAHLKVHNDPQQAMMYLQPLFDHLYDQGIGTVSEIFDGDDPFTPRGCFAQAWSVAEILRVWRLITEY